MRILGIIPARGGSKGVHKKNVKLLRGIPLINYTIESAKRSKLLTKFIVSTEDKEIAEISRNAGAEVPFLRPDHLAGDAAPTLPVIKHSLNFMMDKGIHFDAVCILQPTSPFRPNKMIDACIRKFELSKADTLISVKKVPDHYNPHWVFEYEDGNFFKISTGENSIIPRRQQLPDTFFRDGMIYLVKAEQILVCNTLFGEKITGYTTKGDCINIDTMEDWASAEDYLKRTDGEISI